jgi:hypothetical protein
VAWRSTRKMLQARHNIKGEPIIFAVKAAKINSSRTLSNTRRGKARPQENLLELRLQRFGAWCRGINHDIRHMDAQILTTIDSRIICPPDRSDSPNWVRRIDREQTASKSREPLEQVVSEL